MKIGFSENRCVFIHQFKLFSYLGQDLLNPRPPKSFWKSHGLWLTKKLRYAYVPALRIHSTFLTNTTYWIS